MTHALLKRLAKETSKLEQAGLLKREPIGRAEHDDDDAVIDLTGFDYLGLGRDREVSDAAVAAVHEYGHGLSHSRGFGGSRELHKQLERDIAEFLGQPDAIVFSSGYLANVGLYPCLLDVRDAVFCDAWIHPSTAAGIRQSEARAIPYLNNDVADLEDKLRRSRASRFRVIATDGVFPFSGETAPLEAVCELAERYDALVVVDDSLGIGVLGPDGRGTCAHLGVSDRVHAITGSFGKALGGAGGGFVAGSEELVGWLRQKSPPYLFSDALAPAVAGAASHALHRAASDAAQLASLRQHTTRLRRGLTEAGFQVLGQLHPLLAVVVGDAVTLQKMVNRLYENDIRVHGLCYPVVPEREARIRLQVSASHTDEQIQRVIAAFAAAGRELGVLQAAVERELR